MRNSVFATFLLFVLIVSSSIVQAKNLKPFILSDVSSDTLEQVIATTKSKLTTAGFDIVGDYSPYKDSYIFIVTNDALKKNASKTKFGAYGAVQRVSVTNRSGKAQVSYTNPLYMAAVYRMANSMEGIASELKKALGEQKSYGSKKGLTAEDLANYHYMLGMPYFDDPDLLADHGSYSNAIKKVNAALQANKGGTSKVYQVDLPDKKQTVMGVAMTAGMSSDKTIMEEVDFKDIRATAHLPYEIVINEDGKIYALSAKFRIAINFPDLSMAGKHSFMGIMDAPDAIKKALSLAAGAKVEQTSNSSGFGF